jgi:hypothetical protein
MQRSLVGSEMCISVREESVRVLNLVRNSPDVAG